MKWVNKIKNLWRRLFKKAPNQEEMLEQFLKLISPPKVVNTYKNAIVIQSTIDGDWGDIWDFSLWDTKGIIGWTLVYGLIFHLCYKSNRITQRQLKKGEKKR